MNSRSPLVLGNRSDSLRDIFELLSTANQGKRYGVYYDLTASAEFFLAAVATSIADTYIINDSNSFIVQFWKVISEQPQTVIDTYTNLVKRFSGKQDLATRSRFYQDTLELFNLSAQEEDTDETTSETAVLAGNFAFLINHASTYKLPLSKEESLHCEPPAQLELPEIDAIFSKKVLEACELFQRHVGKITFTCKSVDSYVGLVTAQDVVISKVDRSVLPLLTGLEQKRAAFVALGLGTSLRQDDVLNGHMVRVIPGQPEQVEHVYVTNHLVRPYFGSSLIRYDLVAGAIADKNAKEAALIVKNAIVKQSDFDKRLINEQEEALAKVWAKVLKIDWRSIKRDDNFFRLGGTRDVVPELLSELRQLPQVFPRAEQLTPEEINACSQLKSLTRRAVGSSVKRLIKGDKSQPAIILVHSLLGDGWSEYEQLVSSLKSLQQPVYGLQAPALSQAESYDSHIEELAYEYVLALQLEGRIRLESPLTLVCFSSGGLIGALMVKVLTALNYQPQLILVDCLMPDLTVGQQRAEQALLPILNDKLGSERQRSVFNQRQYDFALWLFREELHFFKRQDVALGNFPEKTVALVTQQSPERLILGHSQIKDLRRFNADHFSIMQLPECITAILDYCRGVTETFRATQQHQSLPVIQHSMPSDLLLGIPVPEHQDILLYSDDPITILEITQDEWESNAIYSIFLSKLCELIIQNRLPANDIFDQICCTYLQCPEKNRAALKDWLQKRDDHSRELTLQPLLREIAIGLIERHYTILHQKTYEDELCEVYENHKTDRNPESYISRMLFEKINSQEELRKEDLIAWWRASGKAVYFEELRRTLNKVMREDYWTCKIEFDVLISFFKVEFRYIPNTAQEQEEDKSEAEKITESISVGEGYVPFNQQPYRTIETGEAYQPSRLIFEIIDSSKVISILNQLKCCHKTSSTSWDLYWRDEVDGLDFKSLQSYQRTQQLIVARINLTSNQIYINFLSGKRLILLAPFFYKVFCNGEALIQKTYFYTLLFNYTDALPNLWSQISLKEADELADQRAQLFEEIERRRNNATSAQESLDILRSSTQDEATKDIPPIVSYKFDGYPLSSAHADQEEVEKLFLGFYLFVRARELVSIKRWFEPVNFTIHDVAESTINAVFSNKEGELYREERQDDAANPEVLIHFLEQKVAKDPGDIDALEKLGLLHQQQGNMERSMQCVMVASLKNHSLEYHESAGEQKNNQIAEENYRASIASDSHFGNNFDFALHLYKQERYQDAVTHLLTALLHTHGRSLILERKTEEEPLKLLFGQAFQSHKHLIKDQQFLVYLGLVLCLNKIQTQPLRDFYILRLVDLVATHKDEKFYLDIVEDLVKLVDFKNDILSEENWNRIDVQDKERDPYSWSQLKRFVIYYPSSAAYHHLAKISEHLKKIDEYDEFFATALSLEGEQNNNSPKHQQSSELAKLLASSLTRALQDVRTNPPTNEASASQHLPGL